MPDDSDLLTDLLKSVSRSFYLSLRILPAPLRRTMSIGYLLARAADTIADTEIIRREKRIEYLESFRQQAEVANVELPLFREIGRSLTGHQNIPEEKILLERLEEAARLLDHTSGEDRDQLRFVLCGLITGMIQDLEHFPGNSPEQLRAFESTDQLDAYTYHAAGIVGEFWTAVCRSHLPALGAWDQTQMKESGIRFGKGLQLVNVLKDTPRDLKNGRCYYPVSLLKQAGLSPSDLLNPESGQKFTTVENQMIGMALEHFEAADGYILAIPRSEVRLRLACIWPLWIGLKTLGLIAGKRGLLAPELNLKISRAEVYQIIGQSLAAVCSNSMVHGYTTRLMHEVAGRIGQ
jgi:farnesyl-diphosphate farnesyltransferase